MNSKREFLDASPAMLLPALAGSRTGEPLEGVGVLRFPVKQYSAEQYPDAREIAKNLAENIRQGSILILPNYRDDTGEYLWDFRIETADPKEIRIERSTARG